MPIDPHSHTPIDDGREAQPGSQLAEPLLTVEQAAASLKTAELSIVTIGWVVFLQVGLLLYERFRYGASLPPLKWVAIVLILTLQAYLVLVPNEPSSAGVVAKSMGEEAEVGMASELKP